LHDSVPAESSRQRLLKEERYGRSHEARKGIVNISSFFVSAVCAVDRKPDGVVRGERKNVFEDLNHAMGF
jgi:hypothetical protein